MIFAVATSPDEPHLAMSPAAINIASAADAVEVGVRVGRGVGVGLGVSVAVGVFVKRGVGVAVGRRVAVGVAVAPGFPTTLFPFLTAGRNNVWGASGAARAAVSRKIVRSARKRYRFSLMRIDPLIALR
jgi:tetrahydrodipicolinate N-succinyltransferase